MTTFDHVPSHAFVAALREEAARETWWRDVPADHTLLIAPRGRELDVYWCGQALFEVALVHGLLRVTTHEKFLLDPAHDEQVALRTGTTFTSQGSREPLPRRPSHRYGSGRQVLTPAGRRAVQGLGRDEP